jgi:hypothetical protein
MRQKAIKDEADKLVRNHGVVAALEAIHQEMKKAKRSKNLRLEVYKTQVAMEVSRRAGSISEKVG